MAATGEGVDRFEAALETAFATEPTLDAPGTVELELHLPRGVITAEFPLSIVVIDGDRGRRPRHDGELVSGGVTP